MGVGIVLVRPTDLIPEFSPFRGGACDSCPHGIKLVVMNRRWEKFNAPSVRGETPCERMRVGKWEVFPSPSLSSPWMLRSGRRP